MKKSKSYELSLPVFKQGDDLGEQIRKNETLKEAFEAQAALYDEASKRCLRMAEVAEELEVDADCHMISVRGPMKLLNKLVKEKLLNVEVDETE